MSSSPSPSRKFLAFAFRNWMFYLRSVFTFSELLFWPLVGLLSVGFMSSFLNLDADTTSFILVGAIAFSILQVTQMDVSYILLFDTWSKAIKHTFVSPVRGYHIVLGAWFMGIIRGSVAFFLLALLSHYFFAFDFFSPGLPALTLFLTGLFINAAVIGAAVCILYLTFGQRAEVAAWTAVGVLMLLCGIYYPVSVLPGPVRAVAGLIPLTHFLEYLRTFYGFEPTFSHSLLRGFTLDLLYLALGLALFERAILRARHSGLITKLSE